MIHPDENDMQGEFPEPLSAFQIAREHGSALPLDLPLKVCIRDSSSIYPHSIYEVHGYDIDEEALQLVITVDPPEFEDNQQTNPSSIVPE